MKKMIDDKKWSMIDNQKYWLLINFIIVDQIILTENWPNLLSITLLSIIWQIVDPEKSTKSRFYHQLQIDNRLKKLNTAILIDINYITNYNNNNDIEACFYETSGKYINNTEGINHK
jgi:hypothetical protein